MRHPADYHMHTPLCHHAVGEPTEYAAAAIRAGLDEIGFSDHSPMARDDFDDWRMAASDLDGYVEKVMKARHDHPGLTIRMGLEVDYLPGHEDWIRELSRRHKWDYFIGSVHYVSESWDLDNPKKLSEWKRRPAIDVWTAYFERLTLAAESGLFDFIGHADLCKKFCFYPQEDCTPLFRKFLKSASRNRVAIEINTAGLRKDCKEMYPSAAFLAMAREEEVAITFGSDAHAPGEVGMDFSVAMELAKRTGYTNYCRFEARECRLAQL